MRIRWPADWPGSVVAGGLAHSNQFSDNAPHPKRAVPNDPRSTSYERASPRYRDHQAERRPGLVASRRKGSGQSCLVVYAKGDGFARGSQIGSELSDLIQESMSFYHRYLDRRGVSSGQLQDLLTPFLVAAETAFPESMSVLKGMSIGAMVPVLELFAINAFEELEPRLESPEGELLFLQKKEGYVSEPVNAAPAEDAAAVRDPRTPRTTERCSSLTVSMPGTTMLAHNEHWLSGDAGNVAVVIDHPIDGRAPVASPTVVCCLPAVGMNALGGVQGIGSLMASDDGVGVPRVL